MSSLHNQDPPGAARLARKLRGFDYFALAFGAMIGAGWLVLMDDWLARGGVGGAMLGFAAGGLLLVPIAFVYGRLVLLLPDAASETAYATRAFNRNAGFLTGWIMVPAYLVVCPWEAVAISKLVAYFFPALSSIPLYRLAGNTVYLPHLLLGLALTFLIAGLNFRGISLSSKVQNSVTVVFLLLILLGAVAGARHGTLQNFSPAFSHGRWVSLLLVLQIVPYYMTGFESVPKCAEESAPGFPPRHFARAIFIALLAGTIFYVFMIALVGYMQPWPQLLHQRFATAAAFNHATGLPWLVDLVFAAAIISLIKIFNGNFVAASRLLFGLGRARLVPASLGRIHAKNQTPWVAVVFCGVLTAFGVLLGDSILVPVTEVGSFASAAGWLSACVAYYRLAPSAGERAIAFAGSFVALAFALLKLLPWVPGHFSSSQYLALGLWLALGLALRLQAARASHLGLEHAALDP